MLKQIEILVVDKDTGNVRHRVHETMAFNDVTSDSRFNDFALGFKRLFSQDNCENTIIQLACRNYVAPKQVTLFDTKFTKSRCENVH